MSAVQDVTNPTTEATEPTTNASRMPETAAEEPTMAQEAAPNTDALASAEHNPETNGVVSEPKDTAVAPVEGKADEGLSAMSAAAEKTTEPITEGQLGYKGPGLLKSLVPSKKEFWLSESPVTPQHMDMYMRGEKPETSHAVVAWASQTGRGLLFFNKKGDTGRTHPASVLPLYDAVDLKKSHPHDITFNIAGHPHTLKASSPAERDGWYVSLERAMEMGKADKETLRSSEGYKAEMEKLNKPNTMAGGAAGVAAAARSRSQPKKSVDADKLDETKRSGSEEDDELAKKNQKSRSTSRGGMLDRLKSKKNEIEAKREEKKAEKEEAKEEKREEKEEKKIEKEEAKEEKKEEKAEAKEEKREAKEEKKEEKAEAKEEKREAKEEKKEEKHGGAAPAAAGAIAGAGAFDAHGTADRALGAPVEDNQVNDADPVATQPRSKRTSIFGRMQSGFSSMKSPSKEKSEREAELKPEVPAKDTVISDTAPQLPEPTSTEPAAESAAVPAIETTQPENESKPVEAAKEPLDAASPKEKSGGFLSNFLGKRNRSVSPSTAMKEAPAAKDEAPITPPKDDVAATEPGVTPVEEPLKPTTETPAGAETTDSPIDGAVDPAKTDAITPAGGKRQSVMGNLGRRASKAFKGFNSPASRKENAVPGAFSDTNKAENIASPETESKPLTDGETKAAESLPTEHQPEHQQNSIGDVTPDAVNIGQAQTTPTVAASA